MIPLAPDWLIGLVFGGGGLAALVYFAGHVMGGTFTRRTTHQLSKKRTTASGRCVISTDPTAASPQIKSWTNSRPLVGSMNRCTDR